METALRSLALKHLMDWSYDELERLVTGSLVYRRFCCIDAGKMPDAKTRVHLNQLLDGDALKALLERLVVIARQAGVTTRRNFVSIRQSSRHHPPPHQTAACARTPCAS